MRGIAFAAVLLLVGACQACYPESSFSPNFVSPRFRPYSFYFARFQIKDRTQALSLNAFACVMVLLSKAFR